MMSGEDNIHASTPATQRKLDDNTESGSVTVVYESFFNSHLLNVPPEILFEIAGYLSMKELSRFLLTNQHIMASLKTIFYHRTKQLGQQKQLTSSPFGEAAFLGRIHAVKFLLDSGLASLKERYTAGLKCGQNAIHRAVFGRQVDVLKLLLSYPLPTGVLEARCSSLGGLLPGLYEESICGWTPLLSAAAIRCVGALELLIDHGADMTATDPLGYTAFHLATGYVYNRGDSRVDDAFNCDALRMLAMKGIDINAKGLTQHSFTALHTALEIDQFEIGDQEKRSREDVIRTLLELGCDVEASAIDGTTPRFMLRQMNKDLWLLWTKGTT